jgi:threonine dehydrogenase-like Zn-dependent dehydrogenase
MLALRWHGREDIRSVIFSEPAGCAFHAVKQAGIGHGSCVLVLGGGPVGQLVAQYARLAGASTVHLSEIERSRAEVAQQMGAVDEMLNPLDVDLMEEILQRTDGLSVDFAIECCGSNKTGILEDTASQAVELTRSEGTTVVLGTFSKPSEFHFNNLVLMECRVIGSWVWHSHEEYREAMKAVVSGQIQVSPLISKKVRIESAVSEGIKALSIDKSSAMKIVIDFT